MSQTTTSSASTKDAAHNYGSRGWKVVQLHHVTDAGVCSCSRGASCTSTGKHPVAREWVTAATSSGADIEALWEDRPAANVGIATGPASGFWVLDIDPDHGGDARLDELVNTHGALPITRVHLTGSGGVHFLFAMPDDFAVTNSRGRLPKGIDVRGAGGQIVAPPSVSDKGAYTVRAERPIAAAPAWLLDLIRPIERPAPTTSTSAPVRDDLTTDERRRLDAYTQMAVAGELATLTAMSRAATRNGDGYAGAPWNETTFTVACNLLELANAPWSALTVEEARRTLLDGAPRDNGFGAPEHAAIWDSAVAKVGTKARPAPARRASDAFGDDDDSIEVSPALLAARAGTSAPVQHVDADDDVRRVHRKRALSDLGNARRLVDAHAHELRWISDQGAWATYADGVWTVRNNDDIARRLLQDVVANLFATEGHLYSDIPDDTLRPPRSPRQDFARWAAGQQQTQRISAALREVRTRPEIAVNSDQLDRDPLLLNCANGTVELRTGALRPHNPTDLCTKQAPVNYDPDAAAPGWESFLTQSHGTLSMREYLQRIVGYSITGLNSERALFIHHGSGANGKSVFTEVISAVLGTGDYAHVLAPEALMMTRSEQHPTAIAATAGKRFIQASETPKGGRLNEALVKGLSGGEQQTARVMRGDFFSFTPTGKIHILTNHPPRLSDSKAIWERLHFIGWRNVVAREDRIGDLGPKLVAAEAPGVLAWMVKGAGMWLRDKLSAPPVAVADLEEYRADQDVFGKFLSQHTRRVVGAKATADALHASYKAWCWAAGMGVMVQPDFVAALKERGFDHISDAGFGSFADLVVTMNVNTEVSR